MLDFVYAIDISQVALFDIILCFLQILKVELIGSQEVLLLFLKLTAGNNLTTMLIGDHLHSGLELFFEHSFPKLEILNLWENFPVHPLISFCIFGFCLSLKSINLSFFLIGRIFFPFLPSFFIFLDFFFIL